LRRGRRRPIRFRKLLKYTNCNTKKPKEDEDMKECCDDEKGSNCGKMIIFAASLLALGLIGGGYMLSQGDYAPTVYANNGDAYQTEDQISTSGTVTEEVTPDLLVVRLSVMTDDTSASEAQTRNAEVTNELLDKLEALGIPDEKIKTTSYSVDEVTERIYTCDDEDYDYCYWEYVTVGYEATHQITVSIEQLDLGGSVIDAAAGTGTNETFVDYVYYTLKDETREEMTKTLLQEAAAEAKAKAQKIADGLGVSLGDVLAASEDYYSSYSYDRYSYLESVSYDAGSSTSTTLSAGEVELSATVSVSYEINN
jgi:uncharacterized protein YggE